MTARSEVLTGRLRRSVVVVGAGGNGGVSSSVGGTGGGGDGERIGRINTVTSISSSSSSSERDIGLENRGVRLDGNAGNHVENVRISAQDETDARIASGESSINVFKNGDVAIGSNGEEVFRVNKDNITIGGTKIKIKSLSRFLYLLNNISDSDMNEFVNFVQEKGKSDNNGDIINKRLDSIDE